MTLLILGIIWTVFGVIGWFGCLKIHVPKEVKDQNRYMRLYNIGYFLIGIPYLIAYAYLIRTNQDINIWMSDLLILVLWIPGLIYEELLDRRFKKESQKVYSVRVNKKVA